MKYAPWTSPGLRVPVFEEWRAVKGPGDICWVLSTCGFLSSGT